MHMHAYTFEYTHPHSHTKVTSTDQVGSFYMGQRRIQTALYKKRCKLFIQKKEYRVCLVSD